MVVGAGKSPVNILFILTIVVTVANHPLKVRVKVQILHGQQYGVRSVTVNIPDCGSGDASSILVEHPNIPVWSNSNSQHFEC